MGKAMYEKSMSNRMELYKPNTMIQILAESTSKLQSYLSLNTWSPTVTEAAMIKLCDVTKP